MVDVHVLDHPVPATAQVDLPGRLPAPVEAAAYFAVAEALANAAKHARARSVHIRAARSSGMLRIEVTDDGSGGADPSRGSGLRGINAIAQRLVITDRAVSKRCTNIFTKLDLLPSDDDNRRVLAVLAYLDS
jgi:signal transduction histidine kinase